MLCAIEHGSLPRFRLNQLLETAGLRFGTTMSSIHPPRGFLVLIGLASLSVAILPGIASAQSAVETKSAHKQRKIERAVRATKALPCPRAQWKDDPVCASAPDEHTLPMPHLNRPTVSQLEGQAVKFGAKWQANNRITQPTPTLVDRPGDDFQSRNTPADTHATVGVDMKF